MPDMVKGALHRVKKYVIFYLYALIASSWNAGIATAVATLGLAAGAALEPDKVSPLDWNQMWAAFQYGALINALFYLRKNPIPETLPAETRPPILP